MVEPNVNGGESPLQIAWEGWNATLHLPYSNFVNCKTMDFNRVRLTLDPDKKPLGSTFDYKTALKQAIVQFKEYLTEFEPDITSKRVDEVTYDITRKG